ncbi:MAG TPA: alkaline phosphatase family protein [Myxococcaceae bacterium]|nr:alkaline phosphatase family protein [Myxococcaceae bacterium]
MRWVAALAFAVAAAALPSCDCGRPTPPDGGEDAGEDGGMDAGADAGDGGSPGSDGGESDGGSDGGSGGMDGGSDGGEPDGGGSWDGGVQTVFLILMENTNWSSIAGSASAPYLNSLLPAGAHAEQYYNPPALHPSESNYLWLITGQSFGIADDNLPCTNHQATTLHLSHQLTAAGISWLSYQEDMVPGTCPLINNNGGLYAPKHNPFVFFDDIIGGPPPNCTSNGTDPFCVAHHRPMTAFAGDLGAGTVARFNFITPNQCNDMHNSTGCATTDRIRNGDTWLSGFVPPLLASAAYRNGGAVIITWDEGGGGSDGPIGFILLSPNARAGYSNTVHYTHSSTLKTLQEIYGVGPLLGDAANPATTDLGDLFTRFP